MDSRRGVLLGTLGGALGGCAILDGEPAFDAIVAKASPREGAPVFSSLQAALAAAPEHATKPFRILVTKGVWRERVRITKRFVHLFGEGRDESVIVFNRSAGDLGLDGQPVGTFGTATVVVRAADFGASRLSIANDFDYVAHMAGPASDDKTGPSGAQAVAPRRNLRRRALRRSRCRWRGGGDSPAAAVDSGTGTRFHHGECSCRVARLNRRPVRVSR